MLAGPMFSYIDSYGTQIWFLLESGANKIDLDIKDYENNSLLEYTFEVINKELSIINSIKYWLIFIPIVILIRVGSVYARARTTHSLGASNLYGFQHRAGCHVFPIVRKGFGKICHLQHCT